MNDRSLLDGISIASPCTADWNQMQGDDRRRFCAQCKLHVHDLSGMTANEATALLQPGDGRTCVRFFRRADGTVLTRDCPVGLRQKVRRMAARAAALCCALWAGAVACVRQASPAQPPEMGMVPTMGEPVMGDVAVPVLQPIKAVDPAELMGRVRMEMPPVPTKK